jgi:hypothetical protein
VLLEQDPRLYKDLLNKVLSRDLRLDAGELEQAADLLAGKKRSLKDEIVRQPVGPLKNGSTVAVGAAGARTGEGQRGLSNVLKAFYAVGNLR